MRFEHVGLLTSRPFNGPGYSLELQRSASCRLRQRFRRWHVLTFYPEAGVRVRRTDVSSVFEGDARPGALGLYPARTAEAVDWTGTEVTAVHLHFDPARLSLARNGQPGDGGVRRRPAFRDPRLAALMGGLYELARLGPGQQEDADAIVSLVMAHLASSVRPGRLAADLPVGALSAGALLDRMHGPSAIEADAASLAKACALSRASFYRRFAAIFGASPHDHLIRSRLEYSKAALVCGRDSIADVADAAGFADQAHFTRTFCARIGLPPGAYADHFGAV